MLIRSVRTLSASLGLVLAVALLVGSGCAPASVAPAATPTPEPIELKLSWYTGETHHGFVDGGKRWAEMIEERSGGRIKVRYFFGEVLGKAAEQYDLVEKGLADAAVFIPSYSSGRFPLTSVAELPFAGPNAVVISEALGTVAQNFSDQEYKDTKLLALWCGPNHLFLNKKPVSTMEDLKGLKIRVAGAVQMKAAEALGITPVTLSTSEMYTGLERGTVDGTIITYSSAKSWRLDEVCDYITECSFVGVAGGVAMNQKFYDSLPKDLQLVVDYASKDLGKWEGESFYLQSVTGKEFFEASGKQITTMSDEELKRMKDATSQIWNDWAKELDAKGLPGTETADAFRAQVEKYQIKI